MKVKRNRLAMLIITLCLPSLAAPTVISAEVPSVMSFQAILLDDQGQIVPDSTYDIVFTIHPDSVSFPPEIVVWTELKTVETSGGLFNTMLGTNSPLTAEVFDGERWLQMRLTSVAEPFLPRTRIGTTPYSYRVQSIDKSSGGEVTGVLNPDSVQVGRSGVPGDLSVVQGDGTIAISAGRYSSQGYSLDISDELSNYHTRIMPDGNGEGGYFSIRRNASSVGFSVDGNYSGTGEPLVSIIGSAAVAEFDMSQSGSGSIRFPQDAVDATETLDEPGVASSLATSSLNLPSWTRTNLLSRTIVAPADGYVFVVGTVELIALHDSISGVDVGIANDPVDWPASQRFSTSFDISELDQNMRTVTVSAIYPITSGSDTYYLVANKYSSNALSAGVRHLSVLYFPTSYGTVSTPAAPAVPSSFLEAPEAERLASERANTARIEREMADIKARLLELERSMTEQESDNPQR